MGSLGVYKNAWQIDVTTMGRIDEINRTLVSSKKRDLKGITLIARTVEGTGLQEAMSILRHAKNLGWTIRLTTWVFDGGDDVYDDNYIPPNNIKK